MRILIPDAKFPGAADVEQAALGAHAEIEIRRAARAQDIAAASWAACDAILAWQDIRLDAALVAKLDKCRIVVRCGIGYERMDLEACGARGIPVEVNEPHHWGMRDAPDAICVAAAYLSALNAKRAGVRDYIAQYMFNSPAELSDAMDLAKMLACAELAESLQDENFRIYRQTRTGLLSYPVGAAAARGHLAASIYLQMALRPHIVHVVSHSEADHAATDHGDFLSSIEKAVTGGAG